MYPLKRSWVLVAMLLALAACLVFAAMYYFPFYGMKRTGARDLKQIIDREIHPGATPEAVLAFLDRQHFDHTPFGKLGEFDSRYSGSQNTPGIGAMKRHTGAGIICDEGVRMFFVFNNQRQLLRYDLRPVYTCP